MSAMPSHASPRANCFVIGAPGAGTTSINRLLRGHPDVFLSPVKEPSHFCPDVAAQLAPSGGRKRWFDFDAYLKSPRKATGAARVGSPEAYARLFEEARGQRVIGECSPFYLSSGAAPELIRIYNPKARIVAALRRPLDRIRAHYEADRAQGMVGRPLLELVEQELVLGKRAHWGNCAYYVGASRYREQLHSWHEHFPAESICVLSFERMRADPRSELGRLFAFLDLSASGHLDLPPTGRDRAARLARRATGLGPRLVEAIKRLLPTRIGKHAAPPRADPAAPVVSDSELQRLEYLLREEGVEEGWEAGPPVRTATRGRTGPAWQTQARS